MARFRKPDLTADRASGPAVTEAQRFDGRMGLISNAPDLPPPAEAVARYRPLAEIERGLRVRKSDIEIAPVHHRLPHRLRAQALIRFLARVLWRVIHPRLTVRGHAPRPRRGITRPCREQLAQVDATGLPRPA